MEVGEIVLADSLRKNGNKVDLILAHHPEGGAYASTFCCNGYASRYSWKSRSSYKYS